MPHVPRGSEKDTTRKKDNKQSRKNKEQTREKYGQNVHSGVTGFVEGKSPL